MVPPNERFDAPDPMRQEIELWLVVDAELVCLERVAQVRDDGEATSLARRLRRIVDLDSTSALSLFAVTSAPAACPSTLSTSGPWAG